MMRKISNHMRKVGLLLLAIMTIVVSTLSLSTQTSKVYADEIDPASKILCKFEDGQEFVRFHSTDYFHYMFRSKSAMTNTQEVDTSWLNKLLGLAGHNFKEVNESILGRNLRPTQISDENEEGGEENGEEGVRGSNSPEVSAFDRFGVAGLRWSSYQGEWKYYHIDPCSPSPQVSPTTYGNFYEGRLEPQSTHNEVTTSIDPRSIQFNKGASGSFVTAFTDTIANGLFGITKAIVTLTIVFVGLSFTDITEVFGMFDNKGESNSAVAEIFQSLFDGVFQGFIFIMLAFTAMYILYRGLIKREIRFAINTLIKTILIFMVTIIIASNPSYWISVPNKAAAYGQAVMINAMSPAYDEKTKNASLCNTEVASMNDGVKYEIADEKTMKTEFSKTSENMQSMIACNMWQTLLFEPWIRGQFGGEYTFEDLNAENVKNNNEEWVGVPSVPLGGGKSINNWALFHLSTQTNAHDQIDNPDIPVLVNNVNADWWRIVDALSDYEEEEETQVDEDGNEHVFNNPVKKNTTEFWQSWIGNNKAERFGVALVSIIFGIVGSIAPLVFGLASAVFGLGITLLMITSPIFLLLGLWGGRGDKIFLGWLGALASVVLKKVIVSVLLILSLFFSMSIMGMVHEIGYITAVILMTIVSVILVKNKDTILNMMSNVNFGGSFDPRQKANQIFDFHKKAASEVTNIASAAAGGGIAAYKSGQSVMKGMGLGVDRQLSNKLYTSTTGQAAARQMDINKGGEKITNHTCITCHRPLGVSGTGVEVAYRDDYGNYYCTFCAEEMGLEKVNEVIVGNEAKQSPLKTAIDNPDAIIEAEDVRSVKISSTKSDMTHREFKHDIGFKKVGDKYTWDDESVQERILQNIEDVQKDFITYKNIQMNIGRRVDVPSAPEPIHQYVDLALINMAWQDSRFDVIENTYKEAWKMWYNENSQYISDIDKEEVNKFIEEIDNMEVEIPAEEVQRLVDEALKEGSVEEGTLDRKIFIMRDGKLVKYDEGIDDRNKEMS